MTSKRSAVDLRALEEAASGPRIFYEIEFSRSGANAGTRAAIVKDMAESVERWQANPDEPMYVTMLGRWSIRIGHDMDDLDDEARQIREALTKLEAHRRAIPTICEALREQDAEVNRLSGALSLVRVELTASTDARDVMLRTAIDLVLAKVPS